MNWIPVGGFLIALAFTTVWFDKLEADRADNQGGTYTFLQMVYAATWGLLGAALILICAMSTPDMVPAALMLIGCALAVMAGTDAVGGVIKDGGVRVRDVRWLLSGIIIFGSTSFVLQDINDQQQHATKPHLRFADLPKVDLQ